MEKTNNTQIFSLSGTLFLILGLIVPVFKLSVAGMFTADYSLLTDMGQLANINRAWILLSVAGLLVLGWCIYVTFILKDKYFQTAITVGVLFCAIVIAHFMLKSNMTSSYNHSDAISFFNITVRLGSGSYMYLLSLMSFLLAGREKKKLER